MFRHPAGGIVTVVALIQRIADISRGVTVLSLVYQSACRIVVSCLNPVHQVIVLLCDLSVPAVDIVQSSSCTSIIRDSSRF